MPEYDKASPAFFTQQVMLIGTCNPDGSHRFAPISWVSYTWGPPPCLVVSAWGVKRTKDNISRTGQFSATVLTPDLLPLSEQFNRGTYQEALFQRLNYETRHGDLLDVPLLCGASYSMECKVLKTTEIGETITYFGEILQVSMSDKIKAMDYYDLTQINPVIYSDGHYFTVGSHLGQIGDYSNALSK